MSKQDGGPAFPSEILDRDSMGELRHVDHFRGMSLRQWYAGMALQGLLAANALYDGSSTNRDKLAADALAHADAMLAQEVGDA